MRQWKDWANEILLLICYCYHVIPIIFKLFFGSKDVFRNEPDWVLELTLQMDRTDQETGKSKTSTAMIKAARKEWDSRIRKKYGL